MEYNNQDIYAVHPEVILRNDGKYIAAGFPDPITVVTSRLAPIEGVVLSMFNGERTCEEIVDLSSAMVAESSKDPMKDTEKLVRKLMERHVEPLLNMPRPVLAKKAQLSPGELNRIKPYEPTDYIVAPDKYRPKDFKLSYPAGILWLLTNECQVNCQYCYMHKPKMTKKEMLPWERLRELLYEANDNGLMGFYVSGGDILCYPHLFDLLEVMDELDFHPISIATKGYISPETAERLACHKSVCQIQFSIDSTVPDIADFLTQSPGFCQRTMESIRNSQKAGIKKVSAKAVITPYNIATIPKYYRDLKAMGLEEILMATYCKSGYHHDDRLFNHPEDYTWLDKQFDKLRQEFPNDSIQYQNGAPQVEPLSQEVREKRWKQRARCTAGRDMMTVCANGKVVACEQMPERYEDYIGDLRTQSIAEAWNGKEMDEYLFHPPREKFAGTPCFDCDEFDDCQSVIGQCVRNSCIFFGTRWAPVPNCPKLPAEPYVREF